MNIDSIHNGIVIDHIQSGQSMKIYHFLNLEALDCSVAIIKNVPSKKMDKKDIIKIDAELNIDLNALGYIDSDITINIIKDGNRIAKYHPELPQTITDIVKCKNPRCVTTVEPGLSHIFKLTDKESKIYRCIYCETKAE